MKSEEPPMHSLTPTPSKPTTPAPAATTPSTPAPTTTGYWAIDPVLQAQSAQQAQTTGTYQYSYYPGYYQYHQPASGTPTPAPTSTTTAAPTTTAPTSAANTPTVATNAVASSSNTTTNSNTADSNDIATLNDALGSAGVDLRAEEESLQRTADASSGYRSHLSYGSSYNQDRTRKQPPTPSFNTAFLGGTMRSIATTHKVTRVPEDSINYMALALRARLGDLVTNMVKAVKHRTDAQFDRPATAYPAPPFDPSKGGVIISEDGAQERVDDLTPTPEPVPMWGIIIRADVAKQLAAIEKVEREEETRVRKERKERADLAASHAAALAAQAAGNNPASASLDGEDGEAPKKKRKKDGPGVTARNMSEDVRKKMSNAVASQAAGIGGRYAWMTAANANAPPPPKKSQPATTSSNSTTATNASIQNTPSMTWGKPYTATNAKKSDPPVDEDTRVSITIRDAMFVISTERGHGGGRGSARGWT